MSDYEMVCELVNKTGATYEEAKYALEACGRDMLAAAVMLENQMTEKRKINDAKEKLRSQSKKAADYAGGLFCKLCRNEIKVIGKREYFSLPIIAAVVLIIAFGSVLLPLAVISLICGLSYVFTGPDFKKELVVGTASRGGCDKSEKKYEDIIDVEPERYTYTPNEPQDKGFFN